MEFGERDHHVMSFVASSIALSPFCLFRRTIVGANQRLANTFSLTAEENGLPKKLPTALTS